MVDVVIAGRALRELEGIGGRRVPLLATDVVMLSQFLHEEREKKKNEEEEEEKKIIIRMMSVFFRKESKYELGENKNE